MPDTEVLNLEDMVCQYRAGHRFDDDEINFRCASLIDAGFVGVPSIKKQAKPDEPRTAHHADGSLCRECAN